MTTSKALVATVGRTVVPSRRYKGPRTFSQLLDEIVVIEPPKPVEAAKMPTFDALPEKLQESLQAIPGVFRSVTPATRRELRPHERTKLAAERAVVKAAMAALLERDEEITATLQVDFDCVAEKEGKVPEEGAVRDAKGHYHDLLGGLREETPIPGTPMMFTRESVADKKVTSLSALETMYEKGEITHAEWLALTEVRRVPTQEKLTRFLNGRKTGERGAEILKMITTIKRGYSTINVRKLKDSVHGLFAKSA